MAAEALKTLHTDLIDAIQGYDEAAKDAQAPEMKALFEGMAALHRRAHGEIDAVLMAKGEQPDEGGSFMSVVHKTVISARSAVTGLNPSSLTSFASGEKRILTAYDEAIAESAGDATTTETLRREKTELAGKVALMEVKAA